MRTSPNQANALRCCFGLRRSPLALGFSCSGEPDVPSRGKQWNLLPFWLPVPGSLLGHKAELPVLPRWRQQRDVLPQWIAIQGQWLLYCALSRLIITCLWLFPSNLLQSSALEGNIFLPDFSSATCLSPRLTRERASIHATNPRAMYLPMNGSWKSEFQTAWQTTTLRNGA